MLLRKSILLLVTFLSVLLCASPVLLVKAEAATWVQNYVRPDWDAAYSSVATSDGGYAITGYGQSDTSLLVKTDASGNMEWNRTYGGAGDDAAFALVATSDGGYALAGYTINYTAGTRDFWLVKTDENGVAPVAPETAWVILPLLAIATISIFISKKKLLRHSS